MTSSMGRAELIDERTAVCELPNPYYRLVVREGPNSYATYRLVECGSIDEADALAKTIAGPRQWSLWVEMAMDPLSQEVVIARLRGWGI